MKPRSKSFISQLLFLLLFLSVFHSLIPNTLMSLPHLHSHSHLLQNLVTPSPALSLTHYLQKTHLKVTAGLKGTLSTCIRGRVAGLELIRCSDVVPYIAGRIQRPHVKNYSYSDRLGVPRCQFRLITYGERATPASSWSSTNPSVSLQRKFGPKDPRLTSSRAV